LGLTLTALFISSLNIHVSWLRRAYSWDAPLR